ncbi:MAG TPA: glycosyltransferase family 2 protein [Acidimicrobiia bacterium]|nr:glycosyltransferase family 2 protein [Acidimicrobiia bacterium]
MADIGLPSVAVMLPVLNEAGNIDACLASLAAQDYPGSIDVLVADGGSTDDTLERLASWSERLPRLRIFENPDRAQSAGLNLLAEVAHAEILIRADAHTRYAPDYVSRSVAALEESGAAAVGGPMVPEGTTPLGRAVAAAFRSPLAIGTARFHHATEPTEADTVYLGAMRKTTWESIGGMRTLPSLVAEDADYYYRLRKAGGRVLIDPAIRSTYQPRQDLAGLWRQFYRYGVGKADMLYINGEFPSWRPLAPLALILGLGAGVFGAVFGRPGLLIGGLAAWLAVVLVASRLRPLVLTATAVMQLAYGLGLLRGLLRRPTTVRAQLVVRRNTLDPEGDAE